MQQEIVTIFGPPGTGKTETLMGIVHEELSNGVPADAIALVTFTKQGAEVGKKRVFSRFSKGENAVAMSDLTNMGTIHSMCFRALELKRSDVISSKDYKNFGSLMGMKFLGYYTEEYQHGDDEYLFLENMERANKKKFDLLIKDVNIKKYAHVKHNYQRFKKHIKKLDYTDMLDLFLEKNIEIPVEVAIIDEAQDLTTLQWDVVKCAFRGANRIYVAGDDDQCIHSWNGADIEILQTLTGKRKTLDRSWRLPANIAYFAQDIISGVKTRVEKPYVPNAAGGEILFYNDVTEIPIKAEGKWYFLARNNCHLKIYETMFREKGIAYYIKDEPSVPAKLIKLIKMYQTAALRGGGMNHEEKVILQRHLVKDYVLGDPWSDVFYAGRDLEFAAYIDGILSSGMPEQSPFYVDTMHGVKGGEADDVVITLNCTTSIVKALEKQHSMDDEIRVLYVAITRAKKRVHIVYPQQEKNLLPIIARAIENLKIQKNT